MCGCSFRWTCIELVCCHVHYVLINWSWLRHGVVFATQLYSVFMWLCISSPFIELFRFYRFCLLSNWTANVYLGGKSFYAFFLCEKSFCKLKNIILMLYLCDKKMSVLRINYTIILRFFMKCTVKWCYIHYLHFQKSEVHLQTTAIQDCEVILNKYILLWSLSTVVSDLWTAESRC